VPREESASRGEAALERGGIGSREVVSYGEGLGRASGVQREASGG